MSVRMCVLLLGGDYHANAAQPEIGLERGCGKVKVGLRRAGRGVRRAGRHRPAWRRWRRPTTAASAIGIAAVAGEGTVSIVSKVSIGSMLTGDISPLM